MLSQIRIPTHETVKPMPAFEETATEWLNEARLVLLSSYILHIHFAPVTNPETDPKIIEELYILQTPNKFLVGKIDVLFKLEPLDKLTKNREVTINGNIDGTRFFEQKMLDFIMLFDIYSAFVKNK